MKKLVTLLLFGAFALSCTDKAYDLSQIETGDVAIGNDDSEFRMPLMTVLVPMADLSANGEDIRSIFDEADIWLPTAATAVDLVRLDSDPDYRTQLIAATVAEMHTSDAKLNAVIGLSYEQYYASFAPVLGLDPAHPDPNAYAAAFGQIFASEELAGELEARIGEAATDYLTSIHIDPVEYTIDALGIDESVIDMLCDNLDPEGTVDPVNTLDLYGEVRSSLPVSFEVAADFSETNVAIAPFLVEPDEENDIAPVRLYKDDIRSLFSFFELNVDFMPQKYYPRIGFSDSQSIRMMLHLKKRGGLNLNL